MRCAAALLLGPALSPVVQAQQVHPDRLPAAVLDVLPPTAHVRGTPGSMRVAPQACRTLPLASVRRRIVDVAVQEWAFFGYRVVEQSQLSVRQADTNRPGNGSAPGDAGRGGRRRPRISPEEGARVATSIGGYWAVTPEGAWIVQRQNEEWQGPDGTAARWNAPWSAAFVSWVMCEAGLGSAGRFERAVAHHTYIDQAIRARDGRAPQAAYTARDIGEREILPGDLLCSSRRPAYRTIADRRRQMGTGARSHCDVVVKVDAARQQISAVGGNVRGTVGLKIIPAERDAAGRLTPRSADGTRPFFVHLELRADPIDPGALDTSPTVLAFRCGDAPPVPALLTAGNVTNGAIAASC